jgi:hypothetical protein
MSLGSSSGSVNMIFALVWCIECLRPSSPRVSYAVTMASDCDKAPVLSQLSLSEWFHVEMRTMS